MIALTKQSLSFFPRHFKTIVLILILLCCTACSSGGNCLPKNISVSDTEFFLVGLIENLFALFYNELFGYREIDWSDTTKAQDLFDEKRNWNDGAVFKIYSGIVTDRAFQVTFYLCVIFLISYLGVTFSLGISTFSMPELLKQLMKIGVIAFFANPSGWQLYLQLIVRNVLGGARFMNRYLTATVMNRGLDQVTSPFAPIDLIMLYIFSEDFWSKIFAVIISNGIIIGWMFFIVILYTVATFSIVFLKAVVIYVTLNIMAAILLACGPIFIMLFMFDRTSSFGKKWLVHLFGNFMQQYMLFTAFFMFCIIASGMLRALVSYEVCWAPFVSVDIMLPFPAWLRAVINFILEIISAVISFLGGTSISLVLPENIIEISIPIAYFFMLIGGIFSVGPGFFDAASLLIVAMMFGKFIDSVADIGADIAGSDLTGKSLAPKAVMDKLTAAQQGAGSLAKSGLMNAHKAPTKLKNLASRGMNFVKEKSPAVQKALNRVPKAARTAAGLIGKLALFSPLGELTDLKNSREVKAALANSNMGKAKFEETLRNIQQERGTTEITSDDIKKSYSAAVDHVKENGHTGKGDGGRGGLTSEEAMRSLDKTISTPFGAVPQGAGILDRIKGQVPRLSNKNFTDDVINRSGGSVSRGDLRNYYLNNNS